MKGSVALIFTAGERGAPMQARTSVEAYANLGLAGDRYTRVKNKYSDNSQVTLIEMEAIEAFVETTKLAMSPDMPRRNLVTRGVRLNALLGKRFTVGGVEMEGMELCDPCVLFAKRTYREVVKGFEGRGGLRARVLGTGAIRPGDTIEMREQ